MKKRLKVVAVVAGVVILATLLIGGAALAADPTPTPAPGQNIFLEKLAARLNLTIDQLTEAVTGARADTLDQLESEGTITPEQREAIESRQDYGCGGYGMMSGTGGGGYGMMGGYGRGGYGMMRGFGAGPGYGMMGGWTN